MQRRRIAMAAVAVAAAGAAVAFTLPSMAGTGPSRGGSAARQAAAGDVAPQLLAAMRRDLGVDAGQARARLQRAPVGRPGHLGTAGRADRRRLRRRLARRPTAPP